MRRRGIQIAGALLGIALITASCSDSDDGGNTAAGGGGGGDGAAAQVMTMVLTEDPSTLDPQVTEETPQLIVNDNIYETLLERSTDGSELSPLLASAMPELVDDTTWRFELRDDVTFTNGEAFNADAVVFSVERIIDPDLNSELLATFGTISGAEAVDEFTVDVTTSAPDPALPARMTLLKMVPPEYTSDPEFADKPVGTGPYMLEEWNRGRQLELVANPDYWGEAASIERVVVRFIGDYVTQVAALTSGEVDFVRQLAPEDIERAPKVETALGTEHPTIVLNTAEGATTDLRVRQALFHAIDVDELIDTVFGGHAVKDDCQVLDPEAFGYNPDLQPLEYDPDQARALLAEAGAEGATIDFLGVNGLWLKDRDAAEAIAGFWEEVGLNVELETFAIPEYVERAFDRGSRPTTEYMSSSNELLDSDKPLTFTLDMDQGVSSNNDAELQALIAAQRTEVDVDARRDLVHQITQFNCENVYTINLMNVEDVYGLSEDLDFTPRKDGRIFAKDMSFSS